MDKEVHFDADIFHAALVIRTIRKGCNLTTDPKLFLDKIVEDIMFSDKVLKQLMEQLDSSTRLVNVEQHYRNLYLVKRDFVFFLDDIRSQALPFAQHLEQYVTRFTQIITSQKTDMMKISDMLTTDDEESDKRNILSSEEYQILFNTEE